MLCKISKKQGFDVFENRTKPPTKNVLIVLFLIVSSVIESYIAWDFRFKPVAEFLHKIDRYGNSGVIAFIFQYVYYFVEVTLVLLTVAFGQKFGETAFKVKHTT